MAPSSSPKSASKATAGKARTARKAANGAAKLDTRAMQALFRSMAADMMGGNHKTIAEFKTQRQDGVHDWLMMSQAITAPGEEPAGYDVRRYTGPASLLPVRRRNGRTSAANVPTPAPAAQDVDEDEEEEVEERKPPVASTSARRSSTPRRRGPARAARPRNPTPGTSGINDLAGHFDRVGLSTDIDAASDAGSDATHVENIPT